MDIISRPATISCLEFCDLLLRLLPLDSRLSQLTNRITRLTYRLLWLILIHLGLSYMMRNCPLERNSRQTKSFQSPNELRQNFENLEMCRGTEPGKLLSNLWVSRNCTIFLTSALSHKQCYWRNFTKEYRNMSVCFVISFSRMIFKTIWRTIIKCTRWCLWTLSSWSTGWFQGALQIPTQSILSHWSAEQSAAEHRPEQHLKHHWPKLSKGLQKARTQKNPLWWKIGRKKIKNFQKKSQKNMASELSYEFFFAGIN